MDLILVRHGLPERDDHSHDQPLSAVGRRQAEATAAFLAGERIDHIVASPLARAQQPDPGGPDLCPGYGSGLR